jgi:ubiquinone biosynthesis protein
MMKLLFKMVFKDGYFHGDLHPGNILVQPDGTLGLIDFGLVGSLNERQRDHILDIMIGISRQDYALVARVFYELGVKVPGVR